MPIARLALTDFRNHASATISPGPGFVLITGANGAGKTNILEAVSLLSPGRGLRGVALGEMARSEGPGGFGVAARLHPRPFRGGEEPRSGEGAGEFLSATAATDDDSLPRPPTPAPEGSGEISLGTGTISTAPERRQVRVNGAPAPVTALSEWLSVLWLTPAMDRLFADSAGSRRRFLDRLVLALEPGHASHAARYEAAMRARNKLLAEPDAADPAWLAALEAGMAEHGGAVAAARERTVAALGAAADSQRDDDFPSAGLALEGWIATADLAAILRANRGRDAAAGRATQGPHRHDLAVTNLAKPVPSGAEGREPAARGSTGEQKALLLGLVLAHADLVAARRGAPPILLLDEVAAHLDPVRRAALFDRLAGRGQVWMTATEPALFDAIDGADATRLTVENGIILPH